MTDLAFIDIPRQKTPRKLAYQAGMQRLVNAGTAPVYEPNATPPQNGQQLVRFLEAGYSVIPEQVFRPTVAMPATAYSLKHGPFTQFLAERDLRSLQERVRQFRFPQSARLDWNLGEGEQPASVVGIRFGFERQQRYETSLFDLVESQLVYDQLRRLGKIDRKRHGHLIATYGDIALTIFGLERNRTSEIKVALEDFPSRSGDLERAPHARIGAGQKNIVPLLDIHSGYRQHHTHNDVVYHLDGSVVKADKPRTNVQGTAQRTHLYLGDLVMLRLTDGIANKQYGVALNQPLPPVRREIVMLLKRLAREALVTAEEKGERVLRIPNKTELSMILSTVLAQPTRSVLFNRERLEIGLHKDYWSL